MGWLLALGTAFFESAKDLTAKSKVRDRSALAIACSSRAVVLVLIAPLAWLLGESWPNSPEFWRATAITVAINVWTSVLYVRALGTSPLGLTLPMLQLSPLFLLVTAPWITGDIPGALAGVGVLLIAIGTYALQLGERRHGFWAPWIALTRDSGTRTMLGVAVLWSVSAPFDQVAIRHSSPLTFIAISSGAIVVVLFAVLVAKGLLRRPARSDAGLLPVGIFSTFSITCQMFALQVLGVPTVIGIKRSSALWSAIAGRWLFREPLPAHRWIGIVIVLAGMIAILVDAARAG